MMVDEEKIAMNGDVYTIRQMPGNCGVREFQSIKEKRNE